MFKFTVSFRIHHPTIDPRDISKKLSIAPDTSWMVGDFRHTPKGKILTGKYTDTYWSYTLQHQSGESLVECLHSFTDNLNSYKDFLIEIRSAGGRCEYFIGWFSGTNSGEILDYDLLSKLSFLQIDLALDIYGQSDGSQ